MKDDVHIKATAEVNAGPVRSNAKKSTNRTKTSNRNPEDPSTSTISARKDVTEIPMRKDVPLLEELRKPYKFFDQDHIGANFGTSADSKIISVPDLQGDSDSDVEKPSQILAATPNDDGEQVSLNSYLLSLLHHLGNSSAEVGNSMDSRVKSWKKSCIRRERIGAIKVLSRESSENYSSSTSGGIAGGGSGSKEAAVTSEQKNSTVATAVVKGNADINIMDAQWRQEEVLLESINLSIY